MTARSLVSKRRLNPASEHEVDEARPVFFDDPGEAFRLSASLPERFELAVTARAATEFCERARNVELRQGRRRYRLALLDVSLRM